MKYLYNFWRRLYRPGRGLQTGLLLGFACAAQAQTITIYRGGTPLSTTYSSFAAAVTASVNDDVLELSADTFAASNVLINKRLSIRGTISTGDTTVLWGQYATNSRVLNIATNVSIRDVIITGGSADGGSTTLKITTGAGIFKSGSDTLTLEGSTQVRGNRSFGDGGGIYTTYGSTLLLTDNVVVSGNLGKNGGGIALNGNGAISGQAVIAQNFAIADGGGVYCAGTPLTITDNVAIRNNSAMRGGGIFANTSLTVLKNVSITDNKANQDGGGIGSHLTVGGRSMQLGRGVLIAGNTGGTASAISCTHDTLMMTGVNVYGNDATGGAPITAQRLLTVLSMPGLINIKDCRLFDTMPMGINATEVMLIESLYPYFCHTQASWWGSSDTANKIVAAPGHAVTIESWVIANWSVNDGLPTAGLSGFPVTARLTMNDGTALGPDAFPMLKGLFASTVGTFADTAPAADTGNKVSSAYNAPAALSTENISCVIDADKFTASFSVGTTSIPYVAGFSGIKIYPNPAGNTLHIDNTGDADQLTIFSMNGHIVLAEKLNGTAQELRLDSMAPGNYILQLSGAKGWLGNTKLVKQ